MALGREPIPVLLQSQFHQACFSNKKNFNYSSVPTINIPTYDDEKYSDSRTEKTMKLFFSHLRLLEKIEHKKKTERNGKE